MTAQPHVYVGETQALGKEFALTIMLPEAQSAKENRRELPRHSCHISLYLTEEQIRKFSTDIIESLDLHLSMTGRKRK